MRRRLHAALFCGAGVVTLVAPFNIVAGAVASAQTDRAEAASEVAGGAAREMSAPLPVETGRVAPQRSGPPAVPRTPVAQDDMLRRHIEYRERVGAAETAESQTIVGPASTPDARPTVVNTRESNAVDINNRNTVSQSASSTLAEPATANEQSVSGNPSGSVYAGNQATFTGYLSYSTNRGSSWTNDPPPGGPTDASILCCDWDAVDDFGRNRTFISTLYTNGAPGNNGLVRIFVRTDVEAGDDCFYDFNPTPNTSNILPDYPHIALTNGFLWLSTNTVTNGSWTAAQVYKLNVNQMAACQSVNFTVHTHVGTQGQRVVTPVEGATTEMFYGAIESNGTTTDTFRLFRWRDADAAPTDVVSTVQNTNFTDPDCRGGTGNTDFVTAQNASTQGFQTRGAVHGGRVTFFWQAGPDAAHTQGHVHGASWRTSDLVVDASPVIFNNGNCYAFPVIGGNAFGELGISIAGGGVAGGGGAPALGFVGVDDADSAGIFFPLLDLVANGTHNRPDGRWGDYLTVRNNHRHSACRSQWVASSFSLDGGNTSPSHVNARYVEFRSTADPVCPK
jgi:hypothetical protein